MHKTEFLSRVEASPRFERHIASFAGVPGLTVEARAELLDRLTRLGFLVARLSSPLEKRTFRQVHEDMSFILYESLKVCELLGVSEELQQQTIEIKVMIPRDMDEPFQPVLDSFDRETAALRAAILQLLISACGLPRQYVALERNERAARAHQLLACTWSLFISIGADWGQYEPVGRAA